MSTVTEALKLLQFGDSVFPVGAFSFSNGLETAVEQGAVHDRTTLQEFVRTVTRAAATGDGWRCSWRTAPPAPVTSTGSGRPTRPYTCARSTRRRGR